MGALTHFRVLFLGSKQKKKSLMQVVPKILLFKRYFGKLDLFSYTSISGGSWSVAGYTDFYDVKPNENRKR